MNPKRPEPDMDFFLKLKKKKLPITALQIVFFIV